MSATGLWRRDPVTPTSACVESGQFLTHHASHDFFERLCMRLDIFTQGVVDQRLVVAAARGMHLVTKPLQDVVIDPDRDARLAMHYRIDGATRSLAEVIGCFHRWSSYCRCSWLSALRAEMMRICSPRYVKTTTRILPNASMPRVMHRSSIAWPSGIVRAYSSENTVAASAKSIPCLRRLVPAFAVLYPTRRSWMYCMYNCADVQEAHETAQQSPFTAKRMPPPTLCHTLRPERNPLARQLGCERQGPRFPQFSVPAMSRLESKPVQRRPGRQDQRERYRAVAVRSDICCERLGIGVGNDADLAVPVATAQRSLGGVMDWIHPTRPKL